MSIAVAAGSSDPQVPLVNLSTVSKRLDSLHQFLSESVKTNSLISKDQIDMVSSEISTAIQQTIINAAALLACSQSLPPPPPPPIPAELYDPTDREATATDKSCAKGKELPSVQQLKEELGEGGEGECDSDGDVVEVDAVELLAEHVHFCEICGKRFKRDANLRMHRRAHGNQFKTPEALAKPLVEPERKNTRFSCPFEGCNRNREHRKFRALKSVTCVRNHFKRSHCPKTYHCSNRSNKKKLFEDNKSSKGGDTAAMEEEDEGEDGRTAVKMQEDRNGNGFFDGLRDGGFASMEEGYSLQDVLEYPTTTSWETEMTLFCGLEQ